MRRVVTIVDVRLVNVARLHLTRVHLTRLNLARLHLAKMRRRSHVVIGVTVVGVHLGGGNVVVRLRRLRTAKRNRSGDHGRSHTGGHTRSHTRGTTERLAGTDELAWSAEVLLVLGRVRRVLRRVRRAHAVVEGVLLLLRVLLAITVVSISTVLLEAAVLLQVVGRVRAAVVVVRSSNGSRVGVWAATNTRTVAGEVLARRRSHGVRTHGAVWVEGVVARELEGTVRTIGLLRVELLVGSGRLVLAVGHDIVVVHLGPRVLHAIAAVLVLAVEPTGKTTDDNDASNQAKDNASNTAT